jgi:GTP-binding protein
MRFIDEALIRVSGGHGGPGCVSFRRETFAPRGGPDGGDGGEGGDVIFVASDNLTSLQDFRYKREYCAPNGDHGMGTNKAGRDGLDIELKIPLGTVVKDVETGEILVDFTENGQRWLAATGGRGGKGNAHFVTSTFQAPKFAQPGEDGTKRDIKMELKLLADAAIIGFPNAGKSTLIARISAARPKIADYAFTTLTPNLGVVDLADHQSFVVADIPGLIEGAHRGLGLGHRFLKHIERTRVFVHLLDGAQFLEDATQPDLEGDESFKEAIEKLINRYSVIRQELGLFNEALLHKPEIVVLNKLDVLESDRDLIERARVALRQRIASIRGSNPINGEPFVISAVSGTGVQSLLGAIHTQLIENPVDGRGKKKTVLPDDAGIRK